MIIFARMWKYLLFWFPMLVIAIANGMLREFVFKKYLNDLQAHQLSTLTLLLFFGGYIAFIIYKFPPASLQQSILIGLVWLVMTLVFEFGFGLYRGDSFKSLLADYNLLQGRLWVLIPLWVLIAPYIFNRIFHSLNE